MKQLTIQDIKGIVGEKGYLEFKFPDVDYTKTKEELEEEITEFGGQIKGTIIDMQTANMLLTVYNALGIKQKEKFERMLRTFTNFEKLVDFGWKCVK